MGRRNGRRREQQKEEQAQLAKTARWKKVAAQRTSKKSESKEKADEQ